MNALPESGVPFGKYLLIRRLAIGGMAEIWLARPIDGAGKPIVLKRILPQFASDPEFTSRFREEAALTLQLVHGNIVPVFEIGSVGEEPYIAMEHVPGYDLRSVLKRSRDKGVVAPVGVAAYVGTELLRGLEYAHRKMDGHGRVLNLVHRDVSPSNVVVSWEGTVKLLDFGIAKAIGRAEATRTGVLRGKVGYMSPEQARGEAIGPASDLFSTGVVIYELLTATRLFDGDSEPEVLERVKSASIAPIRQKNANVPAELEAILAKALTREVATRFANAGEFLAALNKFIVNSGLPADAAATTDFLRALFPEDTVAEEFDARTATHGVATQSAGMSRISPVALQLGGGIAATPPGAGSLGSVSSVPAPATTPRWPLYAAGVAIAVAIGVTGAAMNGLFTTNPGGVTANAPGALYVNSIPAGALVRIDGEDTGRVTPDQFDGISPGPHDVELVLADHETWTDRPVVASANTKVLTAKLVADLRTLRVETDPAGAKVALAGGGTCNAPCSFDGLKPSQTVELTATHARHKKSVTRIRVADVAGAVKLTLLPEGVAVALASATPSVATPAPTPAEPPAIVSFRILPYGKFKIDDGKDLENSAKNIPLKKGAHRVQVTNEPLGVNAICEITVTADETIKIDVTDGKLPPGCRPL